jgi:hypothetical protein
MQVIPHRACIVTFTVALAAIAVLPANIPLNFSVPRLCFEVGFLLLVIYIFNLLMQQRTIVALD